MTSILRSLLLITVIFYGVVPARAGDQYFTDESVGRLPNRSDSSNRILLLDVDGDGDPDVLVSNTGAPGALDRLFINDGSGYFQDETTARLPFLIDQTSMMAAGDIDGDGDPDLFVCNVSGQNRMLVNNGSGVFTDETESRIPEDQGARTVLAGDLDSDGDIDFVTAGYSDAILLLNTGEGFFVDGTEGRLPQINIETKAGLIEDLDMDGDLDLIFGFEVQPGVILSNDGSGIFQEAGYLPTELDTMKTRGYHTGDVDLDGDLDIIEADFSRGFFGDRVLLSVGGLEFRDVTDSLFPDLPYFRDEGTCPAVADFDGNSTSDVFVSKYEQSMFLVNPGTGQFIDATSDRLPDDPTTVSTWVDHGDVDGDGDPDLIISNLLQRENLYINHSVPDTVSPFIRTIIRPPDVVEPGSPQEMRILTWDAAPGIDSVQIVYRVNDSQFEISPCRHTGGSLYIGEIPDKPEGSVVHYYLSSRDERGNVAFDPVTAPDSTCSYRVGVGSGVGDESEGYGFPRTFSLLQNYPNPFNPQTVIAFTLTEGDVRIGYRPWVTLTVFDNRGRKVRELYQGKPPAGRHEFTWDGTDAAGGFTGGGVYFFRLDVGTDSRIRKAVLLP